MTILQIQFDTVASVCLLRNYIMSNDSNFKLMSQSFKDDPEPKCGIKQAEQQKWSLSPFIFPRIQFNAEIRECVLCLEIHQ